MADDHTFPQDWGTGLDEQVDWTDAGSFAHLNDHPNLRGYVERGLNFNVDETTDILNITDGRAFVYESTTASNDHRDEDGPDAKTLEGGTFVTQRDVSGDIALTADAMNYVYLAINQNNNDQTEYYTNTTESPPPEPYIRLGRIDTTDYTNYEENRNPVTTSRRERVTGATHGSRYE